MNRSLLNRTLVLWMLFIPIAIVNGTIRNFVYGPYVGELVAHQISTISMILIFVVVSNIMLRDVVRKIDNTQTLLSGILLLLLTVGFEFIFGHFVMGHSWEKLLHDYNILEGRIWVLVLVTILVSPYLIKKLQPHQ